MPPTEQELAECARECMKRAAKVPEPAKVEEDARDVLQRLADDQIVRIRHLDAVRAVRRVLELDMSRAANRKGDVPRELGLVSRSSKSSMIKQRAIVMMMNIMLDYSEHDPKTGEAVFPYSSIGPAAEAVTAGFYHAGIDLELTAPNVEQIWSRHWKSPSP